jgi:hypothetical protein
MTMFYRPEADPKTIERWKRNSDWKLKFSLWPRRCHITERPVWFARAYRGEYRIKGPGDDVIFVHWHNKRDHLVWLLKG